MAGLREGGVELLLLWLLALLKKRRQRTYTTEQLEAIRQERARLDAAMGLPSALEKPKKPYRWWRYEGLF